MTSAPQRRASVPPEGLHIATIAHEGRLWEAYLEFEDDSRKTGFRGRLRFDAAGLDGTTRSAHTTVLIIEDSHEEALAKARAMDERSLAALLRSALPDE